MTDTQDMYRTQDLKPGHSQKVDVSIAKVRECLNSEDQSNFRSVWADLVEAILSESSENISHYNLAGLNMCLVGHGYREENLFLLLTSVEISPKSTEAHCFLGHAYRCLKKYNQALPCYRRAYELAVEIALKKSDLRNCFWLDASDYLYNQADCELRMGRPNEALLTLRQALHILEKAGDRWKNGRIFRRMSAILRLQKSPLAKVYATKARASQEKR